MHGRDAHVTAYFIGAGSGGIGAGLGAVGGIGAGSGLTPDGPFPGVDPGGAVGDGGPADLPSSTVASSSMLITNSAEPCMTVSVGTVRVTELTNFVVLLRPAPSSICRREPGSFDSAVRPIATPSGWRTSRR